MSPAPSERQQPPVALFPHQASFVETFFALPTKQIVLLRGDVGLGKGTTLAALVSRLMHQRPGARALVLVPAALRPQFVELVHRWGTPVSSIDRFKFREMLDSSTGPELWPRGVVLVMSRDFAKLPDVRASLESVHWDVVIADEAHWFRGVRAELLRGLAASADRVVLATLPDLEPPDAFSTSDATVVEWRRGRLVDPEGKLLDTVPPPTLREVSFSVSLDESALAKTIVALHDTLATGTTQQALVGKLLLRSLQSSPAALEASLRRLVPGPTGPGDADMLLGATEEEVAEDGVNWPVDRGTAEKAGGIAVRALQEMEAIVGDSKLSALSRLLGELGSASTQPRRVAVLTEYVSTLYYVAAEIEGIGAECRLLHGGMNTDDRERSLTSFTSLGGILVATRAATAGGRGLSDVTDLILYDIPPGKAVLREVLGRFDRLGRVGQLCIHVLVPANQLASGHLELLREAVPPPPGAAEAGATDRAR